MHYLQSRHVCQLHRVQYRALITPRRHESSIAFFDYAVIFYTIILRLAAVTVRLPAGMGILNSSTCAGISIWL